MKEYHEEGIDLFCADCLEYMRTMKDKSVDLVLTSPPYNKNGFRGGRDTSKGDGRWTGADISYDGYMDDRDEQEYKNWQINILDECFRLLKPSGSILYNHKVRRANGVASHPFEWVMKSKAIFYQQIIWNRLSGCDHNIGYLDPITELIFWLVKETPKCHKNSNWATEIWNIPPLPEPNHPAPFPQKLCSVAIQLTTDKDDVILDPFSGISTTGVAAKELGRNFTGIEISEKYFDIAVNRIKNTQKSML